MRLVEIVKLDLTNKEKILLLTEMNKYIQTVNFLVNEILYGKLPYKNLSTKMFDVKLPSAIKCQCIRDAKSIVQKYKKAFRTYQRNYNKHNKIKIREPKIPRVKRLVYYVNNQNYKIKENSIEIPIYADTKQNTKSKRVRFAVNIQEYQHKLFENKLGLLRITLKNKKIVACIQYEVPNANMIADGRVMGIDLGVKCPAVSYDTNGRIRFYGNGRKNRYIRRKFFDERRKLQQKKKYRVIKRRKNKERRIMKDVNHKISRQIINEALNQGLSIIKMESLRNIRKGITKRTTRISRKNKRSQYNQYKMMVRRNNRFVNSWSFGQLQKFIEYKAVKAGIQVIYVNPVNTSKECPVCHTVNQSDDRKYICNCGFHRHRDVVGAMNIYASTKIVGNRQSA